MHLNDIEFVVCHSFVFAVATIKISYRAGMQDGAIFWFVQWRCGGCAGIIGFSTSKIFNDTMWSASSIINLSNKCRHMVNG